MNGGNGTLRRLLQALVFITSAAVALASTATTPAGTVIENQADLFYLDDQGGRVFGISGIAAVTVAPIGGEAAGRPADFTIEKSSIPPCGTSVMPTDPIAYEIAVRNAGGLPETLTTVTLEDGSSVEGVLIVDPVPANTDLLPGTVIASPSEALALLHPVGEDLGTWILAEAWDGVLPVDRVALLLPTAQAGPGAEGSLAFSVMLGSDVQNGTPIFNQAGIDTNGDGTFDFTSPRVCNFVDAPGLLPDPTIRFLQPSEAVFKNGGFPDIGIDADWAESEFYQLNPNDLLTQGVWLQLDATSLNLSSVDEDFVTIAETGERLLQVTLSSVGTNDQLLVTLRETGPDTGDFRSIFPVYLTENPIPGVTDVDVACPVAADMDNLLLYTRDTSVDDAIAQGCALHAVREDALQVTFDVPVYGPNGSVTRLQAVEDIAAVDPAGTVFDSRSGEPVSGAIVALLQSVLPLEETGFDSCADLPLDQYERALDPFTGAVQPLEITDAANDDNDPDIGDYAYPFATPFHCYYLDVTPPPGFTFPSVLSAEEVAEFSDIVTDPSYGPGGFPGDPGRGFAGAFLLQLENLFFDIPLDSELATLPPSPLRLAKTVDRTEAGIGDVVVYSVTVENVTETTVRSLVIEDTLPFGFRYVGDTARLEFDGERVVQLDPAGLPGPTLTFDLAGVALEPNESATIHYALRLSAGAVDGSGVNSAVARGETLARTPLSSNVDRVRVELRETGVLSERAIIFGTIYVDADCNDVQNDGEWPVGGVRVFMENGTWAITDENGQYSLFDVEPGAHVLRVDPATLPEGLDLKLIDTRQAARPDSRFVDLTRGEMHRADFAAHCPGPEAEALFARLEARNAAIDGSWLLEEAERFDPRRANAQPQQVIDSDGAISGNRVGPASAGVADASEAEVAASTVEAGAASAAGTEGGPSEPVVSEESGEARLDGGHEMPNPEVVVSTLTREQGRAGTWLWPENGRADDGRFMVVVRGGVTPELYVDGEPVPGSQLGEQILNREADAQVMAWYGVNLDPGTHDVDVRARDPFGNERVLASLQVVRAGTATRLELAPEGDELSADGGRSRLAIEIRLLDAQGNPARGTDFVTLESTEGTWQEADLQDSTPGHQVQVRDGSAVVHLRSSTRTGRVSLRASNGALEDEALVAFIAPMRPLVAAGIASVETRFGSSMDAEGRRPDGNLDVGQNGVDDRVALFMQGRVRGDAHLTLSYDSDKNTNDEELLRDIRPDGGFYPIPGDAAQRGFEAQSRSRLYAKLEKERHSALWGDFVTDTGSDFTDLARVQKTLTGGNLVYDDGATRLQLFAAQPDEQRIAEEIRGNGTALDFRVRADIVRHSEVIELRVRDRNTPGLVLDSRELARFEDYTIDYLSGRIRFLDAVPSLDPDLNPISIFITYDVEGIGEEYDVVGARAEHRVGDALTVAASHTYDGHSQDGSEISGVSAAWDDGAGTRVAASVATMEGRESGRRGEGYRMELERSWNSGAQSRLTYGRGEEDFRNASGGVSENRQELRFEHSQRIAGDVELRTGGTHSERLDADEGQSAVEALVSTEIGGVRVASGIRGIRQETADGSESFATGELSLRYSDLVAGAPFDIGAEYEQALDGSNRRRSALDLEWALRDNVSAYGTYELIDSLQGAAALSEGSERSNFVFGVRANLMADTETFSEYRMRGTADGRGEVAAQGVRGSYELRPGLTLAPTFERIDTISGPDGSDGIAVSLGVVDHRDDNARRRLRLETRLGDSSDFHGVSGSWVSRLDTDWSLALREELRWEVIDDAADAVNHILTVGLARRPRRDNSHHILLLYQWEEDRGSNGVDRTVHLFSTHQNLEVDESLILSGRLGVKFARTEVAGVTVDTDAAVLDGRLIYELTDRVDLDVHGGVLGTEGLEELRYAFGIGAGVLVRRDLRLTAGYNLVGFEDEDLDEEQFLAEGFYAGLQFKFDENSFRWLEGANP